MKRKGFYLLKEERRRNNMKICFGFGTANSQRKWKERKKRKGKRRYRELPGRHSNGIRLYIYRDEREIPVCIINLLALISFLIRLYIEGINLYLIFLYYTINSLNKNKERESSGKLSSWIIYITRYWTWSHFSLFQNRIGRNQSYRLNLIICSLSSWSHR